MSLSIPCGRPFTPAGGLPMTVCRERGLCQHCEAIWTLKETCLRVAERLESGLTDDRASESMGEAIARLRTEVHFVESGI